MRKILALIILTICLNTTIASAQLSKPYFYYKGRDYIVQGKYQEAIESLNILLRSIPNEYEGYFLRGVAKYNLDDLNGALSDFTKAIEENPVYTQAYQYRAIAQSRMGLYPEAIIDFQNALNIRPNSASALYSRGVTYFLNRQFSHSIKDFKQFIRLEPRQPEGYTSLGTSYLYIRDTTAALKSYDKAIAINPYWTDAYLKRGLLELTRDNLEKGAQDLTKAIELDTTYAIAYFYRGVARNNMNDIQGALHDFEKSIRNDPSNSIAFFNRAILRTSIGDYDNAISDYTKVAQSNPNNVLVFYNRAHVYAILGQTEQAIEDYSRSIELYPDFANAYKQRAYLKHIQGDNKGSKQDLDIAENKIKEYRSKMNDTIFSAYADTSKQFNKILNFDASFGDNNFLNIKGDVTKQLHLMPLFRLTIAKRDTTTVGFNPLKYENRDLNKLITEMRIDGLMLMNKATDFNIETIEYMDSRNEDPQIYNRIFTKAITQSTLSQYSSAMNYWNYLLLENESDVFVYLNRAVTQAEMIDFIASLEGNYQSLNLEIDPATRLKGGATKRSYDYSLAIQDMERAITLMPKVPHLYFNLANLLTQAGDYPNAILNYNIAIELFPYFAEAYYNRGIVRIMIEEPQHGMMDLSRAGELGLTEAYSVLGSLRP